MFLCFMFYVIENNHAKAINAIKSHKHVFKFHDFYCRFFFQYIFRGAWRLKPSFLFFCSAKVTYWSNLLCSNYPYMVANYMFLVWSVFFVEKLAIRMGIFDPLISGLNSGFLGFEPSINIWNLSAFCDYLRNL
jgi:hypothetical protein